MSTMSQPQRLARVSPCRICGKSYGRRGLVSHIRACERRSRTLQARDSAGYVEMKADHQYRPWIISAYNHRCIGRGLGTTATGESSRVSLLGFTRDSAHHEVDLTAWAWLAGPPTQLHRVIGMYPVVVRKGRLCTEPDAITHVSDHRDILHSPDLGASVDTTASMRDADAWALEGRRLILMSARDGGSVEEQLALLGALRTRIHRESAASSDNSVASATVNVASPANATVRPAAEKTSGAER